MRSHIPGPGSYKNLEVPKKKKVVSRLRKNSSFNSSRSTALMSSRVQSSSTPGVGAYDIDLSSKKKIKSHSVYSSVFRSKMPRFL